MVINTFVPATYQICGPALPRKIRFIEIVAFTLIISFARMLSHACQRLRLLIQDIPSTWGIFSLVLLRRTRPKVIKRLYYLRPQKGQATHTIEIAPCHARMHPSSLLLFEQP